MSEIVHPTIKGKQTSDTIESTVIDTEQMAGSAKSTTCGQARP